VALIDRHWLAQAAAARQLALRLRLSRGERLVWHAHLCAGRTVQLAYSASWFRTGDRDYRSLVARANRWLHWRDMLASGMRARCVMTGAACSRTNPRPSAPASTASRERSARQPVLAYECTAAASLRGRLWLSVRGVLGPTRRRLSAAERGVNPSRSCTAPRARTPARESALSGTHDRACTTDVAARRRVVVWPT